MSKFLKTTVLIAAALSVPGFAMAAEIDANGDGMLTVAEVQAIHPDITAEQFSAMDLNADGALEEAEVQAATEAGLMPESSDG